MAITVITEPQPLQPVYNEIVYTASSDNVNNTNFSYVVDIYVNNDSNKKLRQLIPPNPNGFLFVDVQRVIEQFISYTLVEIGNSTASINDDKGTGNYLIQIGEQYDVSGVPTVFPNLGSTTISTVFNGSLSKREFLNFNVNDYVATDINSKFLTNAPTKQIVSLEDYGTAGIFNYNDTATFFNVEVKDVQGNFLSFTQVNLTPSLLNIIPTHPSSLNDIDSSELTIGTQPIISNNAGSYMVFLSGNSSKRLEFEINQCENKARLLFLNRLGQFDSFNFTKRKDVNTNIQRKSYKRSSVGLNTDGSYTPSISDKEKVQHYTKTTETIKVVSDWINEETHEWLKELVESPIIYLEENNERIALEMCNNSTHQTKNDKQDKLFNLELEFKLGYDNYRQRG